MITEMTPRASLTEEAKIEIDIVTESKRFWFMR